MQYGIQFYTVYNFQLWSRLQQINNSVKSASSSVQDYIRIFEPLVIGAMRRYTVSTDERIQKTVLNLLIQLMQLRVNYSLLDSEGVFVKILLNQLESAESHLWKDAKNVIPDIFFFLVLLSGERKAKTAYFIQRYVNIQGLLFCPSLKS